VQERDAGGTWTFDPAELLEFSGWLCPFALGECVFNMEPCKFHASQSLFELFIWLLLPASCAHTIWRPSHAILVGAGAAHVMVTAAAVAVSCPHF